MITDVLVFPKLQSLFFRPSNNPNLITIVPTNIETSIDHNENGTKIIPKNINIVKKCAEKVETTKKGIVNSTMCNLVV